MKRNRKSLLLKLENKRLDVEIKQALLDGVIYDKTIEESRKQRDAANVMYLTDRCSSLERTLQRRDEYSDSREKLFEELQHKYAKLQNESAILESRWYVRFGRLFTKWTKLFTPKPKIAGFKPAKLNSKPRHIGELKMTPEIAAMSADEYKKKFIDVEN